MTSTEKLRHYKGNRMKLISQLTGLILLSNFCGFYVAQACPDLSGSFRCVPREGFSELTISIVQKDLDFEFEIVDLDTGNEGSLHFVANGKALPWTGLLNGTRMFYCDGQSLNNDYEGNGYQNIPIEGSESYYLNERRDLEFVASVVYGGSFAQVSHFDCDRTGEVAEHNRRAARLLQTRVLIGRDAQPARNHSLRKSQRKRDRKSFKVGSGASRVEGLSFS